MIDFKEIAENTQRLNNLMPTMKKVLEAIKLVMGCASSDIGTIDNFNKNLCQSTTNHKEIKKIINDPKRAERERKKYTGEE